ncbi:MAG TPA: sigma 54-interacting transcriptional regulator [Thermoanaerobacterales bacterium]|nr:sigma 54-interacting transcriptional regulator [Thermoanaerobacterales bacterium]
MKKNKRIRFIGTTDRVGMIYDVLKAMVSYGINIITMEVNYYISFKIEWDDDMDWLNFKKYMMNKVKEIADVIEIDLMDYEKNEKEINTIMNNVNEGIISVDTDGRIIHINKRAREIFKLKENECLGGNISNILPQDVLDLNEIFRSDKSNLDVYLTNSLKDQVHLLIDIKIIQNEAGVKNGALIILKEMESLRKIFQSISRPSMITFDDIIGRSHAIKNAIQLAKSVAPSNSSIMIRGESGTGKELFARAIHMSSRRSQYPFVAVNCAAVPDALLESEFFGYERGAFTGANSSGKQGLFELATGGTLFLDEIGDLSPHLQAKILRALCEKKVRRIGAKYEIPIDVRIISATNKNLEQMMKEGNFREDLYFRLNVIPIFIPPLRERKEDIPILIQYFVKTLGEEVGKPHLKISQAALKQLMDYDWPGNIRELQNVIERAVNLADDQIDINHLMLQDNKIHSHQPATENEKISLPVDLPSVIQKIEKEYFDMARKRFKSSREMAKALGISHTSVIKKMKKYNFCK